MATACEHLAQRGCSNGCCCCSCSSPRSVAGACFSDSSSSSLGMASTRRSLDSLLGSSSCRSNARSRSLLRTSLEANPLRDGTVARNINFEDYATSPRSSRLVSTSELASSAHEQLASADEAMKKLKTADHELLSSVLPSADEAGLHQRISALRIAFQASERSRTEGEKETEALRKYLASVEAGASSLHLRVQELERQLHLLRSEEVNLEELRGNLLENASKEAEIQAAAAGQAIAAGRDARMELDKMVRHFSSLVKSQEDEIVRLCKELENSRMLYQARAGQVESLKERIQKLETQLQVLQSQQQNEASTAELQKRLETPQGTLQQREADCAKLQESLDLSNKKGNALEHRLQDIKAEKKDVKVQNEWLEQQVNELQNRQVMATIAHYDCELRKVRAVLGGEKAYLLSELALLRCKNKSLRGDLAEWQEKYKALSHHVCGLEGMQNVSVIENPLWEGSREKKNDEGCKLASKTTQGGQGGPLPSAAARLCNSGSNVGNKASQGKSDKVPVAKTCTKDCCMCQERDSILLAAHREIMKLNEINEWLVAACQKDVKLGKNTNTNTSPSS